MNVFTIASIIVLVTLLLAFLIGLVFVRLSQLVVEAEQEVETAKSRYNPRQTMGLKIPVQADLQEQLKEARRLAAKRAAMLPRGANLGIGRREEKSELRTASKGLEQDPISAVKIAAYHTWQGALTGPTEAQPMAPTNGAAAGQKMVKRKLVPGEDFPYTEVTADMSGPERRRIRIQNSKAKMAAYKAMKESGQDMVAAPAAAQAQPAAAGGAQPVAAPSMDLPPEPDYVEITDDMEAAEVRKARINNSKMRSAYNKKLKELGLDPKEVAKMREAGQQPTVPAQAQPAQTQAAPAAAAGMPSDIPPEPDYVEITDDMEAAEVRKARINNSKMRSAYNKKLKEMGLDPKEVEKMREAASQPAAQAQPAAAAQAAPQQQQQAAPAADLPPEPDYVEITDDMEPAEIRKARIDNAKMRSAYNKKLKEMGIDPKSVNK